MWFSEYCLAFCFEFDQNTQNKNKTKAAINICIQEKILFGLLLILGSDQADSFQPDPVYSKVTCHEPSIQSKQQQLVSSLLKNYVTLISCKLEPAKRSRDNGQGILLVDRCQRNQGTTVETKAVCLC